jgi:hypothetical protein
MYKETPLLKNTYCTHVLKNREKGAMDAFVMNSGK